MTTHNFIKAPEAVLDYKLDWKSWLVDDTLSASDWEVDTGINHDSDSFDSTSGTIWLSGGDAGKVYHITHHVTTAGGRQDSRTITISVKSDIP